MKKTQATKKVRSNTGLTRIGQSYWISYLFVAPFMLLFFFFTVLPVFINVFLSFTSYNIIEPPVLVGIENYVTLFFKDPVFIKGVQKTILIAVIVGPGGYLLSLACAWFINELTPKLRAFVTLVFYVPSITGNVLLIWSVLFSGDEYGYANSLLMRIGFISDPIQWLQNSEYILPIVVFVILWMSFGTGFLSLIAAFQGIDKSCIEAGVVDGVRNRWQELWYITLPMMKPQMLFSAVMSITSSFSVGDTITALCGYPTTDYSAHTVMNHLTDYGFSRFEMGYASSIAVILFVMMVGGNTVIKHFISKVGE